MKKRLLSLLIVISIFLSVCPVVNAGIEYRRPVNNYYSEQNPPDFSWRHVDGSLYDIIVATDYELNDVRYKAENLSKNIYNFTEAFEPGVYYWSYRRNGGEWQTPYRVYIPENAPEQVMFFNYDDEDETERIITEILPKTHPRVHITSDTLSPAGKEFATKYVLNNGGEKEWNEWLKTAERLKYKELEKIYNAAQKRYNDL